MHHGSDDPKWSAGANNCRPTDLSNIGMDMTETRGGLEQRIISARDHGTQAEVWLLGRDPHPGD